MQINCSEIKSLFKIEVIEYQRDGKDFVISSGAGIGMAIMDIITSSRYFFDIDKYRYDNIDWESFGIYLAKRCNKLITAGWYTIDVPKNMNALCNGFSYIKRENLYRYDGGNEKTLEQFFYEIKK